jgi:hypothetical protein
VLLLALAAATGRPWRSFFAAAFVAIHPLRVESVAWAAERKDVLAFLMAALTVAAWLWWLRRSQARARYAVAAAAFVAGLLAKPSLVTLPLALPLLALWPGGVVTAAGAGASSRRIVPRVLGAAALLLVPSAAVTVVVLSAQRAGGGLLERAAPSLVLRAENAVVSAAAYLGKTFLPAELSVFYPFPAAIAAAPVLGAVTLLAAISTAAWRLRRRHPYLLVGWAWYLILLAPALGLVPIGGQAMADRYTYLPAIGLAAAAVWLAADLAARSRALAPASLAGAALLLALVSATRAQVAVWRDGESLFTHALALGDNWLIEHEYGVYLYNARRYGDAEVHLRRALALQPDYVLAHFNLGMLLFRQGRAAEAAAEYREALRLRPDMQEARARLDRALAAVGAAAGGGNSR